MWFGDSTQFTGHNINSKCKQIILFNTNFFLFYLSYLSLFTRLSCASFPVAPQTAKVTAISHDKVLTGWKNMMFFAYAAL
jgi:hypothetical protein